MTGVGRLDLPDPPRDEDADAEPTGRTARFKHQPELAAGWKRARELGIDGAIADRIVETRDDTPEELLRRLAFTPLVTELEINRRGSSAKLPKLP